MMKNKQYDVSVSDKRIYYDVFKDINLYPEAWAYIAWSRRSVGKTYGFLWGCYERREIPVYIKRTNKDVNLIVSGAKIKYKNIEFDPSPYAPINRDKGTNIKPVKIDDGLGAFYVFNDENEPIGDPVAYIISLNSAAKVKGFDFSNADYMVLDEFIPQVGEIVRKTEGEMLLDLYFTVARDRQKRGREPLKLFLFANAEKIVTPITTELDITDDIADMSIKKERYRLTDRKIMLHRIDQNEIPFVKSEFDGIYEGMKGTKWWRKSFQGEFTHDDFTHVVGNISLKGYKPYIHLIYEERDYYIYCNQNTGYYITDRPVKGFKLTYNLNTDSGVKKFYYNHNIAFVEATINSRFKYQTFTQYKLITDFKSMFTNF